jgi:hypothetical protein
VPVYVSWPQLTRTLCKYFILYHVHLRILAYKPKNFNPTEMELSNSATKNTRCFCKTPQWALQSCLYHRPTTSDVVISILEYELNITTQSHLPSISWSRSQPVYSHLVKFNDIYFAFPQGCIYPTPFIKIQRDISSICHGVKFPSHKNRGELDLKILSGYCNSSPRSK